MVADRYAGEAAFVTKRIVRERYDQPVPNRTDGSNGHAAPAGPNGHAAPTHRTAAQARATTPS